MCTPSVAKKSTEAPNNTVFPKIYVRKIGTCRRKFVIEIQNISVASSSRMLRVPPKNFTNYDVFHTATIRKISCISDDGLYQLRDIWSAAD